MVAVIDYGAGNIRSVENAIRHLGHEVVTTCDGNVIRSAERVILPGVGAFGDAMKRLKQSGLAAVIYDVAEAQTPLLGICLGLQLLFEESEESPGVPGLGILHGRICRIPSGEGRKIPQIGWNRLDFPRTSTLYKGISGIWPEPYVYFVHSYYLRAWEKEIVTATCEYGVTIHASVEKDGIYACQFHPEKSGDLGMRILENFLTAGDRGEGEIC